MKIVLRNIDELHPYENNPRNNSRAVDYVAKSIKEFKFKVPILLDKNDCIIGGHTRYLAAKKLKLKKVPCITADDMTEQQVKAFRLIDNQVASFASWDEAKLELELESIGLDMSEYGFTLGKMLQNSSEEINVADFDDEAFNTECPFCGFRFNRE